MMLPVTERRKDKVMGRNQKKMKNKNLTENAREQPAQLSVSSSFAQ
jgi:hypothetical protein